MQTRRLSMAVMNKMLTVAALTPCILSLGLNNDDIASVQIPQPHSRRWLSSSSSSSSASTYFYLDDIDDPLTTLNEYYSNYSVWVNISDDHDHRRRRLSGSNYTRYNNGTLDCDHDVAENMLSYAEEIYDLLYNFTSGCDSDSHDDHSSHIPDGVYLVLYASFVLLVGCIFNYLQHRLHIPIPYTVVMLALGGIMELIEVVQEYEGKEDSLGELTSAFEQVREIDPHMVLALFIPGLIFESAYSTSFHIFMKELPQAAMMAGPGVILNTILVGGFMHYMAESISELGKEYDGGYEWTWSFCFMFGTIVSATDPVAVVALLKELGASKRLSTLIEAESLLNDGSAFVLFMAFREYSKSSAETSVGAMILMFFQLAMLGGLFGLLGGVVCCYILAQIFNDAEIEISVCLASVYLFSYIGEYTFAGKLIQIDQLADLGVSGVLICVVMGLWVSKNREVVSAAVEEAMHHFWEMVGFIANTLLFFITGQVIIYQIYSTNKEDSTTFTWGVDIPITILLYLFCHVSRAACIWVMFPVLKVTGYGCTFEEATVMTYGALRGAIGLAMALIVVDDSDLGNPDESDTVRQRQRDQVLFHVSAFVMMTLVVNASTIKYLVEYFGLNRPPADTAALFKSATKELIHHRHKRLGEMKFDKHYNGADWEVVRGLQPKYDQLFEELYPEEKFDEDETPEKDEGELQWSPDDNPELIITMIAFLQKEEREKNHKNALEMRVIQVMKSSYWEQYEKGLLSSDAVNILVEASETAIDEHDLKLQMKLLQKYFDVPWYVKWMHKSTVGCIKSMSERLLFSSLGFAVEVASGFEYAIRSAIDFCGVLKKGVTVSEMHVVEVHAQLDTCAIWIQKNGRDLARKYPEVHTAIQTKFAAQNLLNYQKEEIEHLLHKGFFDEAEHGRVLGCCEGSLNVLFHTSFNSLLPSDRADQSSVMLQCPLFSDLKDSEKEQAMEKAEQSQFLKENHEIMPEGSRTGKLFVITAGAVDVFKGDKKLHTKERGDVLDVYSLLMDNAHDFTFKVAIKDTTGYWLDKGLLKLLKDENVNFWDTLWKVAAADVIRYYFKSSEVLAGVDTSDLDNMVHASPLQFYAADDQERSQIRVNRGLGVLLSGHVVHITDMNSKAAAPAILPQADDPYLAIEDSVVLNLDLNRRDYHAEKTSHLSPALARKLGIKSPSTMPQPTEDSMEYDDDYDTDYASDDMASDAENSPEPPHGDATGAGKRDDDLNEQEQALLDGANNMTEKPDLKILAADSSVGAQQTEEAKYAEKPLKSGAGAKSGTRVSRHKSTSALKRDKFNYDLQDGVLDDDLKGKLDELAVKESFEALKVLLNRNEQLFDHLKKFHIQNVQKQAKQMQIKLSGPDSMAKAQSDSARGDGKGSSLFARPKQMQDTLMPRSGSHQRRSSRSRSARGAFLDVGGGATKIQKPHHQPTATPIIIKPEDFGSPQALGPQRKSDAKTIEDWEDAQGDADVVDLHSEDNNLNNAMD